MVRLADEVGVSLVDGAGQVYKSYWHMLETAWIWGEKALVDFMLLDAKFRSKQGSALEAILRVLPTISALAELLLS